MKYVSELFYVGNHRAKTSKDRCNAKKSKAQGMERYRRRGVRRSRKERREERSKEG